MANRLTLCSDARGAAVASLGQRIGHRRQIAHRSCMDEAAAQMMKAGGW
jgi:hypothetical protein